MQCDPDMVESTQRSKQVVGVRFKDAEPIAYFDPSGAAVSCGDRVVVETILGLDLGKVVTGPCPLVQRDPMMPVRSVVRVASNEDEAARERLTLREAEAVVLAKAKARNLGLQIKPSKARFSLDERKVAIEYTGDPQVDVRELRRKMSDALDTRVDLRSIGPRDEARNVGGWGRCGRALCCSEWMDTFESVTVRMAKEQALPISADSLAGQCGRLKCCLRFEYEQYRAANKALPRIGERVNTPQGPGKVIVGHPLRDSVTVLMERKSDETSPRTAEISASEIERLPRDDSQRR